MSHKKNNAEIGCTAAFVCAKANYIGHRLFTGSTLGLSHPLFGSCGCCLYFGEIVAAVMFICISSTKYKRSMLRFQ